MSLVASTKSGVDRIEYRDTHWTDLRINALTIFTFSGFATQPELLTWKTNLRLVCFDVGDILYFSTQMPHNYKPGSNLEAHVHWTPHSRGVAENGNTVNWRVELAAATINGTFPATTTFDCTATCDGTNDKHQYQDATASMSGTGLSFSHMIVGRVYRLAGDSWSTNTAGNRPALLELDFHYEIDKPGTQAETTL